MQSEDESGTGISPARHSALYGRLRAAVLSRHFALSRLFRVNQLSPTNLLETERRAGELASADARTQEQARWRMASHVRENPLLLQGQLLTCLAVEHALGERSALRVIRSALESLASLYKFRGNHFDGYIVRWDAVASDNWLTAARDGGPQLQYCRDFLIGPDDKYLYCTPLGDPRAVPMKTDAQLPDAAERSRYLDHHWGFVDTYRRWEVSMDELVGLVLGYFMVHHLVEDAATRAEVARQVDNLGDYLAEHGYLLVRPGGGFTARGASGVLPAMELPFSQAFQRITGKAYASRADLQGALEKAGVWKALEGPVQAWMAAGVAANVVLPPVTGLGSLLLSVLSGVSLTAPQLGRVYALHQCHGAFDVWNEAYAKEFALAALFKELAPGDRFRLWLAGTSTAGVSPATGFPPYLAALSLDGADPAVRNQYLGWLGERVKHPALDDKSCFSTAVAALLGGGPAWEARLVGLLEQAHASVQAPPAEGGRGGDLELFDELNILNAWEATSERTYAELDYMAGLALAWLHVQRHEDAGDPVTTARMPGFQPAPAWPPPSVPAAVLEAARAGTLTLPLDAIQRGGPAEDGASADLFAGEDPPHKPPEPAPLIPHPPLELLHELQVAVRESDADVDTGITLTNGDEYELEASGRINAGVLGAGDNGPQGWTEVSYDPKFPLHGGMDPVNAHPYCLLGKLNNYFFIGTHRARERYFFPEDLRLALRINDDTPGNGGGTFICRVRVWGSRAKSRSGL